MAVTSGKKRTVFLRSAITGCITLLLCTALYAEQESAEDIVPPPHPQALESDWWEYFGNAGDGLGDRIDLYVLQLRSFVREDRFIQRMDDKGKAETTRTIDEIALNLIIYHELVNQKPDTQADTPVAADNYSLKAYLNLASQVKDTRLELELVEEEIRHRESAIKQTRDDLDDMYARYIQTDKQAASRFKQGLLILRDRLRVEVAQLEVKLLNSQAQKKSALLTDLGNVLEIAAASISPNNEDVSTQQLALELAEEKLEELNEQANVLRLRSAGVSDTPVDRANSRLLRQRLLDIDVQLANAELSRVYALVSLALLDQLGGAENIEDPPGLDETLIELKKNLEQFRESSTVWRRATNNESAAAEAQLAKVPDQNKNLVALYRSRIELADSTLLSLASLNDRLADGEILKQLAENQIIKQKGSVTAWISGLSQELVSFWKTIKQFSTGSLFTINETPITLLGLFRVVVILAAAWWMSKLVRKGLERFTQKSSETNRAAIYTIGRLFHYTVLAIGLLIGLSSIGLDFTKLALFVSALGVGLGFGLQAIFSNFVAGLMILFERSLKVGDFVELESGVTGEVKEINIRSTLITTNDNIDILVPNSEFVSGRVINWTLREVSRRIHIPFGVAYGTDKELTKKAALEAAASVRHTLTTLPHRQPRVWLVEFGDNSLNYELVVWLKSDAVSRPGTVNAAYTWELETVLAKYGIEIPFPQLDLHLRSSAIAATPES